VVFLLLLLHAAAAPNRLKDVPVKKRLRDFDIGPL
jgi:hypothetical protein